MNTPRSLHFPPPPAEPKPGPDEELAAVASTDLVLAFGQCYRDVKLLDDMLRSLPFDVQNYHGNLQVIRSCAVRLNANIHMLLEAESAGKVGA